METQVIILGGGVAGLALAIDLKKRGISHRIFERDSSIRPQIKGEFFQPVAIPYLKRLGVFDRMVDLRAVRIDQVVHTYRVLGHKKKKKFSSSYSEYEENAHGLSILHEDILKAFREEYQALGGEMEFGISMEGLSQSCEGVTVQLSSGKTLRARYFVGCDGKYGISRKLAQVKVWEGKTQRMMMAALVSGLQIPKNEFYTEETREGVLYAFWSNRNLLRVYLCVESSVYLRNKNRLLKYFRSQIAQTQLKGRTQLKIEGKIGVMPTIDRMIVEPSQGRYFWIGDAMGTVDPLCGHGMALSLEQAANLAEIVDQDTDESALFSKSIQNQYLYTRHLGIWIGRLFMQNAWMNQIAKARAIRSYQRDPLLKRHLIGLFSGLLREPFAAYDLPYLLGVLPSSTRNQIKQNRWLARTHVIQNKILTTPIDLMKDEVLKSARKLIQVMR